MKKIMNIFLSLCMALSMNVAVTKAKETVIERDSLIQTTKVVADHEMQAKEGYASYKWYVNDELQDNSNDTYIPSSDQYESWIRVEAYDEDGNLADEDSIYFSQLPVCYIETDGQQEITSKEEYLNASMYIQGNEIYNAQYNGSIQIKGRGNSSWYMAKKPYKLKLDAKTDLFGMGSNKHWVLLASFTDESNMRNKVAQDICGDLGVAEIELTWVDVILNGEYIGLYELSEHLRIDSGNENRIDITDWEDIAGEVAKAVRKAGVISKDDQDALEDQLCENMAWITSDEVTFNDITFKVSDYYDVPSINGGYLFELDTYYDDLSKFTTNNGLKVMINSPENLYTNEDMMSYCKELWNDYEEAYLSVDGYNSKGVHYSEIADIDSMAAYWLAQEIIGNNDARGRSRYAYQDTDGLIEWGPGWDYDYGGGVNVLTSEGDPTGWKASTTNSAYSRGIVMDGTQAFFKEWTNDPLFVSRAVEQYWAIRDDLEALIEDGGTMDQYNSYIQEAGIANQNLWYEDMVKYYVLFLTIPYGYNIETSRFKSYMQNRIAWLDEQFASVETAMASLKTEYSTVQYNITDDLALELLNTTQDTISNSTPVNGIITKDTDLRISIQSSEAIDQVKIYIDGLYYTTTSKQEIEIPSDELDQNGNKIVINAIGYDADGNVVSQNFVRVLVNGEKPHEHQFELISDTATYTSAGIRTYQCACGETYSEESEMLPLPFEDVANSKWYYIYIAEVYQNEIMTGKSDTIFDPYGNLTRGQLATILYRMAGSPEVASLESFSDVETSKFYAKAIAWAKETGVVTGYNDGTFKPAQNITRQELAIMLQRFTDPDAKADLSVLEDYPDAGDISSYARNAMAWAVSNQILTGDQNKLNPKSTATRAQAAKMISVTYSLLNN